jgi:hypothetical protein
MNSPKKILSKIYAQSYKIQTYVRKEKPEMFSFSFFLSIFLNEDEAQAPPKKSDLNIFGYRIFQYFVVHTPIVRSVLMPLV